MGFSQSLSSQDLEATYVSDALDSFVKKQSEFTAYDITKFIRDRVGSNTEVQHNLVRDIVHKLMAVRTHYDYVAFNKDFGGQQAIAYKPVGNVVPVSSKTQPTITPIGIGTLVTNKNSLVMKPKSEGRVTVPASELKKIGVVPNDFVNIIVENDKITIYGKNSKQPTNVGYFTYGTDKYGSIRLRKHLLGSYKAFRIKTDTIKCLIQLVGEN